MGEKEYEGRYKVILSKAGYAYLASGSRVIFISSKKFYAPYAIWLRNVEVPEQGSNVILSRKKLKLNGKVLGLTIKKRREIKVRVRRQDWKEVRRLLRACLVLYPGSTKEIERVIAGARNFIESKDFSIMKEIVGFGSGLTPSGDDFLSGFLLTNNKVHREEQSEKIILGSEYLSLTNKISSSLLYYSQNLLADELSDATVNSLIGANYSVALFNLMRLARRGGTSGLDFFAGCLYGLLNALKAEDVELERDAGKGP